MEKVLAKVIQQIVLHLLVVFVGLIEYTIPEITPPVKYRIEIGNVIGNIDTGDIRTIAINPHIA